VNYLLNFPEGFKPTTHQETVLSKIEKAFTSGKKFVICCAPTGSGKSFISKAISNSGRNPDQKYSDYIKSYEAFAVDRYGNFTNTDIGDDCKENPFGTMVLTITKNLQNQYKELFDDIMILKGKMNYDCALNPKNPVEFGECVFDKKIQKNCIKCDICPYYNAKRETLASKHAVLNYSMFLSLPEHVSHREYVICDEASKLEEELVNRYSKCLSFKVLKRFGYSPSDVPVYSYNHFNIFLQELRTKVYEELNNLRNSFNKKKSQADNEIRKFSALNNFNTHLSEINDLWSECQFLLERRDDGIYLTPINVQNVAKKIFNCGDKILLMSATIIDHANFAKRLGIEDYEYIEMESTFDPKKAPIYSVKNFEINYKNLKQRLPQLKKYILDIAKSHKNEKGIIHTHTMEITEYLRNNIVDPRFIFRGDKMTNEDILAIHNDPKNKNTIIVSPSMTFGVDLKGDLAKFQILVKAAFLPLNDERVKTVMESDKNWYVNKMLDDLIQACGRGVRSKQDECITYILDSNITNNVLRYKHKLPKHFLDRFV
jgi:Rad3-related DNA helicase